MSLQCTFIDRESGHRAAVNVYLTFNVQFLIQQIERVLKVTVRSLKFKRRTIAPSDKLSDLGLTHNSVVFVNSPRVESTLPAKTTSQRPRVVGFDTETIKKRVSLLGKLGYPLSDCEKALRAAAFNMDRAADYLASGVIPEPFAINYPTD
jgi:hypothetical protein